MYGLKTCLSCGQSLRSGTSFCSHCGTRRGELSPVEVKAEALNWTPSTHWTNFRDIIILYGSLLAISFVSHITMKITTHPLVEVAFWVGASVSLGILGWKNDYEIGKQLRDFKLESKDILKLLGVITLVVLFIHFYFKGMGLLGTKTIKVSQNILKHDWPIWSAFVLVSICPGILEEIAFRGIIYPKLKEHFSVREALFIQAACFSVLHLLPTIFISHLAMGFAFGYAREKTGSLILPMILHMLWNGQVLYREIYF